MEQLFRKLENLSAEQEWLVNGQGLKLKGYEVGVGVQSLQEEEGAGCVD
jgi:hypothetical protein